MDNFQKKANETIDLVNRLSVNLESLIDEQNNLINKMPVEMREKLATEQSEINSIMNHVKNGDVESLINLSKRYANTNSK
jgi:CRISPR/Cas system CMR-associated protein Cmr5 small subunit